MNFLAHLYLSGDDEQIIVGNFIADKVKGKNFDSSFEAGIARGIELHRVIDHFTDTHPLFRKSTARLWSRYRHYSRVIVDMYYDHFLASGWEKYSSETLEQYADKIYKIILNHKTKLPEDIHHITPIMIKYNWLVKYATVEGLGSVFNGMAKRTTFDSKMEFAVEDLILNYSLFQNEFLEFFVDIKQFAKQKLDEK